MKTSGGLWGLLIVLFLVTMVGGQPQVNPKLQADAINDFQQSVYHFGLELVLADDRVLRGGITQMWQQLTKLRERVCPNPLKQHVREAVQVSSVNDKLLPKLDQIGRDLDELANRIDVATARDHLQKAREAATKQQAADYRREAQSVMDAVIGQLAGAPLDTAVPILREASNLLTTSTTTQRREQALEVLRKLPNFEKGKSRAYREALTQADGLIASAADLYVEGYQLQGKQQLIAAGSPLSFAQRAAPTPAAAQKVSVVGQQLQEADRMMSQGFTLDAELGLSRLRGARTELGQLVEASNQQIVEGQALPK